MSESNEDPSLRLLTLGEIALEVAHELRNLLLVIDASTYLAKKNPAESGPHLEKIDRSVRSARAVVDDIFMLARDESLPFEQNDVRDILSLARSELPENSAEWVDRVEGAIVRGHDRLLARYLKVIYENAIQVDPARKPRIETRAHVADGSFVIDVEDDGPGVPVAMAANIFDPLVTSRPGGTGMGLPLARRIAGAHRGTLSLVKGVGTGACFRLTIPRV